MAKYRIVEPIGCKTLEVVQLEPKDLYFFGFTVEKTDCYLLKSR